MIDFKTREERMSDISGAGNNLITAKISLLQDEIKKQQSIIDFQFDEINKLVSDLEKKQRGDGNAH